MTYADRYHLTPEQSRFLAKKKWDENVYCGMKMENRAVTFPQTKTILEGVNVPGVQIDDIQAILNMRDAWRFLIGSIDEDVTLEYVCKLNGFIARNEALEWGKLRTGSVAISGTDYTPPVPQEAAVRQELAAILAADTLMETILAYSDQGNITDTMDNPGVRMFMEMIPGYAAAQQMLARETILLHRNTIKNTANKGKISTGLMAMIVPVATDTALPPLKPKYTGYTCPRTAQNAAI